MLRTLVNYGARRFGTKRRFSEQRMRAERAEQEIRAGAYIVPAHLEPAEAIAQRLAKEHGLPERIPEQLATLHRLLEDDRV